MSILSIPHAKKAAFSLVELSIVLVILGLLVGGILAGRSLIRAAELRSVSTDLERFSTAINSFRDKYSAYPGDMTNATRYWGEAGGNGANAACQDTISTTAATCDGNGDGLILTSVNPHDEGLRGWQHLANGEFIEGTYVGTNRNLTAADYLARSVAKSKISNAGYMLWAESLAASGWTNTRNTPENHIRFGAALREVPYLTRIGTPWLRAEEAWNIDTKLDDGEPGLGKFWAHGLSACISSQNALTSDYILSSSELNCLIAYSY